MRKDSIADPKQLRKKSCGAIGNNKIPCKLGTLVHENNQIQSDQITLECVAKTDVLDDRVVKININEKNTEKNAKIVGKKDCSEIAVNSDKDSTPTVNSRKRRCKVMLNSNLENL